MKTTRGQACEGGEWVGDHCAHLFYWYHGASPSQKQTNKQNNKNTPSKFEIIIHKCKPNYLEVEMGELKVKIIFP